MVCLKVVMREVTYRILVEESEFSGTVSYYESEDFQSHIIYGQSSPLDHKFLAHDVLRLAFSKSGTTVRQYDQDGNVVSASIENGIHNLSVKDLEGNEIWSGVSENRSNAN